MPRGHRHGQRHLSKTARTPPVAAGASSPVARVWLPLGLLALTIIPYAAVHSFDFVSFDDQVYVTGNPHVRDGLTWAGAIWAFSTAYAANWHPLTWLSHMVDVQLFGLAPGPPHVVNLGLHAANTVLLYLLFRQLTGAAGRSALIAALFAVHPLHVESVAWVAERKDLLSTFFALLTLRSYASYVQRRHAWSYAAALLWFACGLMAKPMVVTLPAVLLLLDVWPLGRTDRPVARGTVAVMGWRALVIEKVPFAALALGSSVITVIAQRQGGAVASFDAVPLVLRLTNAAVAYVTYLGKTVWPTGLAVFYPMPASPRFLAAGLAVVALAAVTVLVLRSASRRPYLAVGWLWFLGALVPVLGIVQVGAQSWADRYMYFPMIGLLLAAVWGTAEITRGSRFRRPALVGAIAAVGVLAAMTRAQAGYWKEGITLWQRAVAVTSNNSRAHANLGASLAGAGRHAEAAEHYRQALEIQPAFPQAHNNLGLALAALGQGGSALPHYREAVRLLPTYAEARNNLANLLMDLGRVDDAIAEYREALRLRPADAQIHNNLGTAYAEQGRMADATSEFLEAVRLEPDRAEWQYAAGMAYAVQGERARAIAYLQAALRLEPDHARARRALGDLTGSGSRNR